MRDSHVALTNIVGSKKAKALHEKIEAQEWAKVLTILQDHGLDLMYGDLDKNRLAVIRSLLYMPFR